MADVKKTSIGGRTTIHLLNIKRPSALKKRLKRGFNRVEASISSVKTNKIVKASLSFLDMTEDSCGVFVSELLTKGSEVELTVTDPVILKISGVVAWCVPVQSGVDRASNRFRAGIQFIFHTEAQKKLVIDYCQKAALDPMEELTMPEVVETPPPVVEQVPEAEMAAAAAPPVVTASELTAEVSSAPLIDAPPTVVADLAPVPEQPAATEPAPVTEEEKKVA